ncbi:MAG: hypothetical protein ACI87A_001169 [Planctomycetota bacterium]|jgi:hypothetical protein
MGALGLVCSSGRGSKAVSKGVVGVEGGEVVSAYLNLYLETISEVGSIAWNTANVPRNWSEKP